MNWLRVWLRRWLGIEDIEQEHRRDLTKRDEAQCETWGRLEAQTARLEMLGELPTFADLSRKQFEIENALRELKEMREAAADPKRVPVVARSMRQFKALMEQD